MRASGWSGAVTETIATAPAGLTSIPSTPAESGPEILSTISRSSTSAVIASTAGWQTGGRGDHGRGTAFTPSICAGRRSRAACRSLTCRICSYFVPVWPSKDKIWNECLFQLHRSSDARFVIIFVPASDCRARYLRAWPKGSNSSSIRITIRATGSSLLRQAGRDLWLM